MGNLKGKSMKVPTLDEFQENERWCRRNLQTSLEDIEAAFVVQLPEVDATDEETLDAAEYDVEQAMQQAHNILADAEYWLDAFRALRERQAKAKQKKAA
jgi:hypothetical protein